jgi:hypothetical protein
MNKTVLITGIIFVLIGMSFSSISGIKIEQSTRTLFYSGNIFYVGGSGPGNYTKIQDAIDNSSDGDTVFVFDDSSPYNENLNLDKSITLKGENKETTVIKGIEHEICVNISSDNVVLSGFTIQNYDNQSGSVVGLITILSNFNVISDNIILGGNAWAGVEIPESEYNTISNNIISCHFSGISIYFGKNNNITKNIIKDCLEGISLVFYSNNNSITWNNLINNSCAIETGFFCINGIISYNNISYNDWGITAFNCFNYKITNNNLIKNFRNTQVGYLLIGVLHFGFEYKSLRYLHSTIKWDGNYWNRPRSLPKPIIGQMSSLRIPWIQFDWHPAQEPYDIPSIQSCEIE